MQCGEGEGGKEKEKEWTDCVQSAIRAFDIAGDWKATVLKAEVWADTVMESGRRFMIAWRKEEVEAARYRQEKREATRLGRKLLSHTDPCRGRRRILRSDTHRLVDESKESLCGPETDRDLRSA